MNRINWVQPQSLETGERERENKKVGKKERMIE
jgi:hypothetical protein